MGAWWLGLLQSLWPSPRPEKGAGSPPRHAAAGKGSHQRRSECPEWGQGPDARCLPINPPGAFPSTLGGSEDFSPTHSLQEVLECSRL